MIRKKLRDYQKRGRGRALSHPGFALFCEPRTGKTLISYATADRRKPDRLLIVCPKGALGEWHAGLEDWTGHECEVIITTFGLAVTRREFLKWWLSKARRPMMVVDELHKIKQRGSKQSRAIRVLGKRAMFRLGLTGTPIAEGIEDAWAYFDYLDPKIFGPFKRFKKRYLKMGGFGSVNKWTGQFEYRQVIGYKRKEEFAAILHRYSFRVRLSEVAPTKVRIRRRKIVGSLDARERAVYESIEENLEAYVNGRRVSAPLVITQAMKLHQITGGYVISDPKRKKKRRRPKKGKVLKLGSSKVDLLRGLIRGDLSGVTCESGCCTTRKKFVVIARFKHEIRAIRKLCEAEGLTVQVIGKDDPWTREFRTDVVILQAAMAASIDLSASNSIVFFSWDYSYINFEQARFRVLSYSQTRATYYFLLMRGTIDEQLYTAITRKKKLATLICDTLRRRRR